MKLMNFGKIQKKRKQTNQQTLLKPTTLVYNIDTSICEHYTDSFQILEKVTIVIQIF